jgi:glycosyltransferase involved in cell wall biosynthesis
VLIPALSSIAARLPEVETVVAGPDDDGEWRRIDAALRRASPRPRVRYVGPVHGAEKDALLASASVLVLPSHSENFGQVVVEALACETPVVASRNTPWQRLETEGAGRWVENTPSSIASALLSVLLDPERAQMMGVAGRRLAAEFSWPEVGRAMMARYDTVAGRRGRAGGARAQ